MRTWDVGWSFRHSSRITNLLECVECFRGLTGSQRTPRIWGVIAWYQSLGIQIPRA